MQRQPTPTREQRVAFLNLGISFYVLLPHFVRVSQFCGWMDLGQKPSLVLGSSWPWIVWSTTYDPWSCWFHPGHHIAHKYCAIEFDSAYSKLPQISWYNLLVNGRKGLAKCVCICKKGIFPQWNIWNTLGTYRASQKPAWYQGLVLVLMSMQAFISHWDLVLLLLE